MEDMEDGREEEEEGGRWVVIAYDASLGLLYGHGRNGCLRDR